MGQRSERQTIFGHLEELRKRLLICIFAFVITTIGSFLFVEQLRAIIIRPAGELELVYITPPEALMADLRLAIMAGIVFALPVLVYQLIAFLLPALEKEEKKILIPAVLAVVFFFSLGVLFAYYVVFPFTIRFFLAFATDSLQPLFTISAYLSFAVNFIFAFGIVFQMPLLFFILGYLGIISAEFLRKYRKYAVLVILLVAALLTPPDVFSQMMLGIPLYGLYEVGIWAVAFSQGKRKRLPGRGLS
ncbi:MAG TPA: twin-arginine translocase subunit TatC [Firmicutes bacterium]|nr:twin-arginine translocase subunit TatC [Bacillota bacterium]